MPPCIGHIRGDVRESDGRADGLAPLRHRPRDGARRPARTALLADPLLPILRRTAATDCAIGGTTRCPRPPIAVRVTDRRFRKAATARSARPTIPPSLACLTSAFRSELVVLDVADLAFGERNMMVTRRHSKGAQQGKGVKKGVPSAQPVKGGGLSHSRYCSEKGPKRQAAR